MEPPEKKKNKTTTIHPSPSQPPPPHPSFTSLPDELVLNCLSRIPKSYYPKLSIVSKTFRSLLSSNDLYTARSHLGTTEQCLYICLWDRNRYEFPQWYTLWKNPNPTKKRKKTTTKQLLVPVPPSNFPSVTQSIAVVGYELYVISEQDAPSSSVRVLDCRTHTWRDGPSMNVERKNPFTCVYDGKIYIMGGVKVNESSFAEVFDTKTQTWEVLPDPESEVRKCYIHKIAEVDGKIIFGGPSKMYAYDTKRGEWECCGDGDMMWARLACVCVVENESYYFGTHVGRFRFEWRDVNGGVSKEVYGVGALGDLYMRNGGSGYNTIKEASCGGKLFVMWEGYMRRHCDHKKKIWCAEISFEKRDGGEVWGNVEWVDVVLTVPRSCQLLHCVTVSV